MTTAHKLNSRDQAAAALMALVKDNPHHRNPLVRTAEGGIIMELMRLCVLPDIPVEHMSEDFDRYWKELPSHHRHRLSIPSDVAEWLTKVQRVFDGPADFDAPGSGCVLWKDGLRRCKSQLLL